MPGRSIGRWVRAGSTGKLPEGWTDWVRDGSQSGQGAIELGFPGPALGRRCRVRRPLAPSPGCAPCYSLPDGVVGSRHASDIILTRQPIKRLPNSCQMGQRAFPAASGPSMSSGPRPPPTATGPVCPKSAPTIASPCPSRPFPVPPQRGSVDSG